MLVLHLQPACLIRTRTGILCPGCGLSRAFYALLSLNLREAWAYNPTIFLLPLLLLLIATDARPFSSNRANRIVAFALVGGICAIYLVRLILWHNGQLPQL